MIAIIDYEMGNLRSVQKAFEHLGYEAQFVNTPEQIRRSDQIVLPGVGAFKDAMRQLNQNNLSDAIRESVRSGVPFLGICLGLQLLFDASCEGGQHAGLGIIPGTVEKFDLQKHLKVPHMGWNQVKVTAKDQVFSKIRDGEWFYFVHSYFARPQDESIVALSSDYGHRFCAAIQTDNVYACQFHPEKSQESGLSILKRFADL
jgi:imidazole glycerol-phosphate synthase subunit HisH